MRRPTGVTRALICFSLIIGLGLAWPVSAQDLEPRRWSHLPTGMNVLGMGYVYTDAFIYFSPALKIENADARVNTLGVSAIHTFNLAGKSARIGVMLPFVNGRWRGDTLEGFRIIHRRGMADPRVRLSVNLYGAPALKGAEFARYIKERPTNTVVGASLAVTLPLGEYIPDLLINIGANRWSFRPQFGVVHKRGPWSFELTASAFFFTDNNAYFGKSVLKQKPLYAAQAHAVYSFDRGHWVSLSAGYGVGGRISIDKVKTAFTVDNWLWAASVGMPVGKSQSIKLTWLSGRTQNLVGRDSDNLLLSWSTRWMQ